MGNYQNYTPKHQQTNKPKHISIHKISLKGMDTEKQMAKH